MTTTVLEACPGIREDDGFHGTDYVHCKGCATSTRQRDELAQGIEDARRREVSSDRRRR